MIDEKKLIDELIRKDQSLQEHLKRAEDDGNELFNFGLKSQLAMLKSIISCVAKQPKINGSLAVIVSRKTKGLY